MIEDDDPFEVLGLDPATCDDDAVSAAFRRLAKGCHPDSPAGRADPAAAARFRALCAARDRIADAAGRAEAARSRRGRADGFGGAFDAFFDKVADRSGNPEPPRRQPRRGADIEREIALTLEQSFSGGRFTLRGEPGPCRGCDGTGEARAEHPVACPACGGEGRVRRSHGFVKLAVECVACGGGGATSRVPCTRCAGQGRIEGVGAPFEVVPGARDGSVAVLTGYGGAGADGGARGDLRLTFRLRPHAVYARDGDDLAAAIRVELWDAASGCLREIDGIDGHAVGVEIPPGTANGTVVVVPGRGMPSGEGRGSVRVRIAVPVPPADTPALRRAYATIRAEVSAASGGSGATAGTSSGS